MQKSADSSDPLTEILVDATEKKFEDSSDLLNLTSLVKHLPSISKDESQEEQKQGTNLSSVKYVKLGGNSYGLKASEYISSQFLTKLVNLQEANLADIFTGRLKDEIPKSMNFIIGALEKLEFLKILDFSHNACGAPGMKELSALIKSTKTLVVLKITNVGISPVSSDKPQDGGVILGEALEEAANKKNDPLRLEVIEAGRNRLENKGIFAIAKGLKTMNTLKVLKIPQNGIKEAGMNELLNSLSGQHLNTLDISDNWIKGEAVGALCKVVKRAAETLTILNISDSTFGLEAILHLSYEIASAKLPKLEVFATNYNEIESSKAWKICFTQLIGACLNLKKIEAQGNQINKKTNLELAKLAQERKIEYNYEDDDEEEPEEEEEMEEEEADQNPEVADLISKLGSLKI